MLVPGSVSPLIGQGRGDVLNYLGNISGSGVPYSGLQNIGLASPTKAIVLGFVGNLSGAQNFSAVSVAGVSLTQAVAASTQDCCSLFWANVAAGGNQTVAFTSNAATYSCHMWEVDIGKALSLINTATDTTIPLQASFSPANKSAIIGVAKNRGTTTWNWNNSDLPDLVVGNTVVTGSNRNVSAGGIVLPGSYNLEATSNSGANQPALAALQLA